MYKWTPDSIRFRMDAAEYTRFDAEIAAQILPRLKKDAYVCDAGCGLGYLSLALARNCARLAAIDTNAGALDVLRKNIDRMGIQNIDVVERDLFSMKPEPKYDAMVFCFFGRVSEALFAAKAQCRDKVFLIKKNWENHRFTLKETPLKGYTFEQSLKELDALQIPYKADTFSVEMGQPFRTLADAALFFETYRQEADSASIAPEQIEDRLFTGGSGTFPYYLPSKKMLGLIEIDVRDIPDAPLS
ncbi:MAG TPA: methyltransferase [Clostridia bacterium]|nr:methyltransferase [Clostridia bacterium]